MIEQHDCCIVTRSNEEASQSAQSIPKRQKHPKSPQSTQKHHKIEKRSAQAWKRRIFQNKHHAYTRHSFSRVQGPQNTPKVNQKRSKGPSNIASIFASNFRLFFYRFLLHFGTPLGSLWELRSVKRGQGWKRPGGPGANCAHKLPKDTTRSPKSFEKHHILIPRISKMMPKG